MCISMSLELNTSVLTSTQFVGKGERTLVKRQHRHPICSLWQDWAKAQHVPAKRWPDWTLWSHSPAGRRRLHNMHNQIGSFAPVLSEIPKIIEWGKQTMTVLTGTEEVGESGGNSGATKKNKKQNNPKTHLHLLRVAWISLRSPRSRFCILISLCQRF